MDRSSLEELLTPINSASDPTSYSVRVAVLLDGERPEASDWHVAEWRTVDGVHHAALLVGPGGAVELGPGAYRVWAEITAPPEKPVVASPRFSID
ncbi:MULTISPECIES: hypothetical protein [Streptomyces]|uniref:Uncharacterized protein n=1 Tax=Streptomyces venezuelae (strain ATCC 10712 / CBS 650.69 / DSM 40230 / JCM 4526 / NBRC 13096 / PD 04745) TaxID=953739 RepID=F2RL28_STRVP|nr:hypothetical protein [Streptomyces venezuelae]APE21396.1 hypothetical protein vnz_10420 [Streptomyces venezuelae]QER98786.1 hypothetical protein DEJ43_10560 [Streptomyces venezuelae ATCC 10712]CCA55417.1 hypothetical protein SVEN_2131 [Streptomyces venezuelae ATCC 10712]